MSQYLGFRTLEFAVRKAVFPCFFYFRHHRLESIDCISVLACNRCIESIAKFGKGSICRKCIQERSIRLHGHIVVPFREHVVNQILYQVCHQTFHKRIVFGRKSVVTAQDGNIRRSCLRVGNDADKRFRIGRNRRHHLVERGLRSRDVSPHILYFLLDFVHIYITDNDYRLKIRAIPCLIKIPE